MKGDNTVNPNANKLLIVVDGGGKTHVYVNGEPQTDVIYVSFSAGLNMAPELTVTKELK